jgi:putative membrane protein
MQKLIFGLLTVFSFSLLIACNGRVKSGKIADTDSITSADSLNALTDTIRKSAVAADPADARFMAQSVSAALTELALGKLAQVKGENKRVKNFGVLMIKDLTKANNKMALLAKNKNITIPTAPLPEDQEIIDQLSQKSGQAFDMAYVDKMIADHKKYIPLFENEARTSVDPDIKKFASKTLSTLKNHLDAIMIIHGSMH